MVQELVVVSIFMVFDLSTYNIYLEPKWPIFWKMQPVKLKVNTKGCLFTQKHTDRHEWSTMNMMKVESALCSLFETALRIPKSLESINMWFKNVFNIWPLDERVSCQFLALCLFHPINILRACLVGVTSPLFQKISKNIFRNASRTRFAFGLFWALIPYKCTALALYEWKHISPKSNDSEMLGHFCADAHRICILVTVNLRFGEEFPP